MLVHKACIIANGAALSFRALRTRSHMDTEPWLIGGHMKACEIESEKSRECNLVQQSESEMWRHPKFRAL